MLGGDVSPRLPAAELFLAPRARPKWLGCEIDPEGKRRQEVLPEGR